MEKKSTQLFLENISVEAVVVSFSDDGIKVLLTDNSISDNRKVYGLPSERVKKDISLDETVKQLVESKAGASIKFTAQVKAFGDPDRYPGTRVVSITYLAVVDFKSSVEYLKKHPTRCVWVDFASVPQLMADHNKMVSAAAETLKSMVKRGPVAFHMLPSKFTLSELQMVFELTLGVELDKRNFRKKLQKFEAIADTKEKQTGVAHRAAKLYRFEESLFLPGQELELIN